MIGGSVCQAKYCSVPIGRGQFMCLKHWRMLPRTVKDAIYYHAGDCEEGGMRPSKHWLLWARRAIFLVAVDEERMSIAEAEEAEESWRAENLPDAPPLPFPWS